MFSKRPWIEDLGILASVLLVAALLTSAPAAKAQDDLSAKTTSDDDYRMLEVQQTRLEILEHLDRIAAIKKQILEAQVTRGGLLVLTIPATFYSIWKGFAARAKIKKLGPVHPNNPTRRRSLNTEIDKMGEAALNTAIFGASSNFFIAVPRIVIRDLEQSLALEEADLNSALKVLATLAKK